MSYVDVLTRISQIQGQIASLDGSSASTSAGSGDAQSASTTGTGSSFATQLAQAQSVAPATANELGVTEPTALTPTTTTVAASPVGGAATSLLSTDTPTVGATTSVTPTSSVSMPGASGLSSAQQQFAARLSADTGLDGGVVDAWVLAEESGGAATARQSANNNDWLNIGYTDSATYGQSDSVWSSPVTAADATAGWLSGKNTIPGYGTASAGVQSILQTVGQAPTAQITAIQGSGWASSGYPDLPSLYQQMVG